MSSTLVYLRAGQLRLPVNITPEASGTRLAIEFGFNRDLLDEIKAMQGARWHGYDDNNPRKVWTIANSKRNRFQLAYLAGQDPYSPYDSDCQHVKPNREVFLKHQEESLDFIMARKRCILALQMGLGKTLVAIEVMEKSGFVDWAWVGPKSANSQVYNELKLWNSKVTPLMYTYDRMRIQFEQDIFNIPYGGIVFDEAAMLKDYTTKRTQAARGIIEKMCEANPDCFVVLMSGAPAPKSPCDWWSLCELTCPGFLKESSTDALKKRLSVIEMRASVAGGKYPHFVTWLDDPKKCAICGQYKEKHGVLAEFSGDMEKEHAFTPSKDEVSYLYERMKGLVFIKFKKDCLDLPPMTKFVFELPASRQILQVAKTIRTTTPRAITAMIKLRELSDGFQFKDEPTGHSQCEMCYGIGQVPQHYNQFADDVDFFRPPTDAELFDANTEQLAVRMVKCERCNGSGEQVNYTRTLVDVGSPKDQLLRDLLDEHIAYNRLVTYAAFTASVDKICKITETHGWSYIRADGRGWLYSKGGVVVPMTSSEMLEVFQANKDEPINFVGQAGAAGSGLTLTASPTVFYFSNSFNGNDRIQSLDRVHRIGMRTDVPCRAIDCVHLPIDRFVLNNLDRKIQLLGMTMGVVNSQLEQIENSFEQRKIYAGGSN